MKNNNFTLRHLLIVSLLCIFTLVGCDEQPPAAKQKKSKRPAQLVELATVTTRNVQHSSQRSGTLRARKVVRIFNQEEGTLTSLPFYEGDTVNKGDVLLRIDDRLLRAQLDKANATLSQARQDVKRLKALRKKRLVAEDELNRAHTALDVAEAELRLLTTRQNLATLHSPMNGIVSKRLAEPGDVAPRHTHLLTLIDTDTLITEVAISDLLIPSLASGDNVDVRIDALPDQVFKGSILRIHPTIDASTRNGIVEVILDPAPGGARPGQFCRVTLHAKASQRRLVPFTALRQDSEGSYVFAVNSNNKATLTRVTTGLRFIDSIEILEGLEDGQKVIVKGFLGLKHGKGIRTANKPGA